MIPFRPSDVVDLHVSHLFDASRSSPSTDTGSRVMQTIVRLPSRSGSFPSRRSPDAIVSDFRLNWQRDGPARGYAACLRRPFNERRGQVHLGPLTPVGGHPPRPCGRFRAKGALHQYVESVWACSRLFPRSREPGTVVPDPLHLLQPVYVVYPCGSRLMKHILFSGPTRCAVLSDWKTLRPIVRLATKKHRHEGPRTAGRRQTFLLVECTA